MFTGQGSAPTGRIAIFLTCALTLVLLALPSLCPADIYRWVDASGYVHYGDRAPPNNSSVTALMLRSRLVGKSKEESRTRQREETIDDGKPKYRYAGIPLRVPADPSGVYWVDGAINGRKLRFIVDTGANIVTLNRQHAKALGLDIDDNGSGASIAKTAGGDARITHVKLASIQVGDVLVHDAQAVVTNNLYPESPLLGMSFLSHAQLVQRENVLEIRHP